MISAQQLYHNTKELELLFVEDDEQLLLQMYSIFAELFKRVDTAENGQIGLQKHQKKLQADKKGYDLIITDINMPQMNGIEMIKAIYKTNPLQSVIVISAHNESDYLVELLRIGVSNFLIKPISHDILITTLYKTTQSLLNEKLIQRHYKEIEQLNAELSEQSEALKKSNEALIEKTIAIEKSMRIIEGMHHKEQLRHAINITPLPIKELSPESGKTPPINTNTPASKHLKEIEHIINGIAVAYAYKEIKSDTLNTLSNAIKSYAAALPEQAHYETLKRALKELALSVCTHPKCSSADELSRVYTMLESFFFIYAKWQNELNHVKPDELEILSRSIAEEISILIDLWQNER